MLLDEKNLARGEEMKIRANGIEMNYEMSGKKGGPVVMLSHSLASSLVMWDPQMKVLEKEFSVLRYDVRGHGKSEATQGPYSLELLAEDAIRLLDGLGIDKVHWVGLSMGGMIGQGIALNYRNRLISLVLCDTSASVAEESHQMRDERIALARQKGIEALLDQTMERWFTPSFLLRKSPAIASIRREFLSTSLEGYIGCMEAIRRLNYLPLLERIDLPVLVIVGADDMATPVSAAEAIHARIRNSVLVILKSCRHLSNVEQPKAFNDALMQFLKRQNM